MSLRITTAAQGVSSMPAGTRSTDPGLTPFQRAQLRAHEQGAGANLAAYGSLAPNSQTNQYRQALGAQPVTAGMTNNGMMPNGQMAQQPQQPQMPSNPLGGMVTPQPVGGATPLMSQPPRGLPTGQGVNPAAVSSMAPSGSPTIAGQPVGDTKGNYQFKGVGPAGNAIFTDPATGERFAYDGSHAEGLSINQSTSLPQSAAPQTGLIGAEEALRGGLDTGLSAVETGLNQSRADLGQARSAASDSLSAFSDPGNASNRYQAALSGALGGQAQSEAFNQYQESPGFQYLLDNSERALRRNAAATGGLGGGNVQRALSENAIGLAAQDFDNNFNRLSTISDRGMQSASQLGGYDMALGDALAGVTTNASNMAANMAYGTGNNMAAGRTRAGEMIAGNIQDTSSNLADLMNQSGAQQADYLSGNASSLAQLLAGAGRDNMTADQQLAAILANIATGAGSQVGGLPSLGGTGQNPGILNGIGNAASGIGGLLTGLG